ncbi:MAG: LacI family DNA-binding transcriptional regulator [Anaerolineae bacterium]|nr:LacI family DNA-binding transcriptional regulator [Anaerolineae bacterium]
MTDKNIPSPATLHDVAKLAGVSYQTVSRVVNNMPHVSPRTLEKVNRAIAELNYQPNRAARSLVTGKSNAIHVVVFDMYNLRMIPSMEYAAHENGFQFRLTGLHGNVPTKELGQKLYEITTSQIDGVILVLPWVTITDEELQRMMRGIPYVIVGCSLGYETNSVLVDQQHGTRLAVEHLLELGHRKIAAINGSVDHYYDARLRRATLLEVLEEHNLKLVAEETGNFSIQSGFDAARRLLEKDPGFTALFCANDEMALGAIRAIKDCGLRVPEDISVVGFDDQYFAGYCDPPLTTIRQDFEALGAHSFQQLLSLLKDPDMAPHQRILYSKLIVRKSTAHPAH